MFVLQIDNMYVPELRKAAQSRNLQPASLKADLQVQLRQFMQGRRRSGYDDEAALAAAAGVAAREAAAAAFRRCVELRFTMMEMALACVDHLHKKFALYLPVRTMDGGSWVVGKYVGRETWARTGGDGKQAAHWLWDTAECSTTPGLSGLLRCENCTVRYEDKDTEDQAWVDMEVAVRVWLWCEGSSSEVLKNMARESVGGLLTTIMHDAVADLLKKDAVWLRAGGATDAPVAAPRLSRCRCITLVTVGTCSPVYCAGSRLRASGHPPIHQRQQRRTR